MLAGVIWFNSSLVSKCAASSEKPPEVMLRILFEACRVRVQQTGKFPSGLRDLAGVLAENQRRNMPEGLEFHDPDAPDNRLFRASPLGSRTPCLRLCLRQDQWLNVAYTGWIYRSKLYWQSEYVDLIPRPFANPDLLRRDCRAIPARAIPRSPECGPGQIDLVPHCNAIPTGPWFYRPADDGAGHMITNGEKNPPGFHDRIASGLYRDNDILFDVRGAIQLDGLVSETYQGIRWYRSYPTNITGIVAARTASQLHLLTGAIGTAKPRAVVAFLRLHFASGETALLPLRYGEEIASAEDSCVLANRIYPAAGAPRDRRIEYSLDHACLQNPRPMDPISTIDFVSGLQTSHPYIVAITFE